MWSFMMSAAACVLGCGNGKSDLGDLLSLQCEAHRCSTFDEAPMSDDYAIELETESALLAVQSGRFSSDSRLVAGDVVLRPDDPSCVPSSDHPCRLVLKRLRLDIGSFRLPTTQGDVHLENVVLSVKAPLGLVNSGSGYVVAVETDVETCGRTNGLADSAVAALGAGVSLNVDFQNETLPVGGAFPVRFHFGKIECEALDATAMVVSAARAPWTRL
jgi:hypothetical protein